jgi:nudix-type nucleoside diphosphatase (YffH/AdpP family)
MTKNQFSKLRGTARRAPRNNSYNIEKFTPMKKVHIISEKVVFDDKFKVLETRLQFEKFDGQMSPPLRRLTFERGDAAAALLWQRDKQRLLLVEQFRQPTYTKGPGWIIEAVAGMVKPREEPEAAMRREILEEIGYQVRDMEYIATFYLSPGGSSERIFLYYAEVGESDRVEAGGGAAGEHEDIRLVEYSKSEIDAALDRGEIEDAKTLVAVQWWELKKLRETEGEAGASR